MVNTLPSVQAAFGLENPSRVQAMVDSAYAVRNSNHEATLQLSVLPEHLSGLEMTDNASIRAELVKILEANRYVRSVEVTIPFRIIQVRYVTLTLRLHQHTGR